MKFDFDFELVKIKRLQRNSEVIRHPFSHRKYPSCLNLQLNSMELDLDFKLVNIKAAT